MKGLLLIGGKSTRLPGKCFLPMKDRRPVFMSAVDLFSKCGVDKVVVPVLPGHEALFKRILNAYWKDGVVYELIADDQSGVCNAITRAANAVDDDLFVLCGDNIYEFDVPQELLLGGAAVRDVPEYQRKHLASYRRRALITPWVLPRLWARLAYLYSSVPEMLDRQKAPAVEIQGGSWWDIGTEETYEAYWTS